MEGPMILTIITICVTFDCAGLGIQNAVVNFSNIFLYFQII